MSQPLSFQKVVEGLQRVLHDLHDLSEFGAKRPFTGIVIEDVLLQYRDHGPSYWRVSIQPAGVEEVEEVDEAEILDEPFEGEDEEPLSLEEEFLEGFEEGRKGS